MDKKVVGQRIRQHRDALKLSLQAVGDLTGVTKESVSKWEAGVFAPKYDRLKKLADLFGMTVEELTHD